MSNNHKIKELLTACEIEFVSEVGEVTFSSKVSEESRSFLESLRVLFLSAGYRDETVETTQYGVSYELIFKLNDANWQDGCRIFSSTDDLWAFCQRTKKTPDIAFVYEGRQLSLTNERLPILDKFEAYFVWTDLLRRLSEDGDGDSLKFIVSSEKGLKRHSISTFRSYKKINSLNVTADSAKTAAELIEKLNIIDAHKTERKEVMLNTLIDVLDGHSGSDHISWLIDHAAVLKRKYYENYEIYTQKFSVNKLLNEVFEKQNDYASKVLENVSSNQAKALALPGALIAAGALMRSANFASLILICIGIYIVYVFTKSANAISRDALGNLSEQVDKAFGDYTGFNVDGEVVTFADKAKKKISEQIEAAQLRLTMIDNAALYIFATGCIFSAYSMLSVEKVKIALAFLASTATSVVYFLLSTSLIFLSTISRWFDLLAAHLQNFS